MIGVLNLVLLALFHLCPYSNSIRLNNKEEYNQYNLNQRFTIPTDGRYEIVAAGASGGGNDNTPGGRGGIAAGVSDFKAKDEIFVSIGDVGKNNIDCGGSGGGGATIVYRGPLINYPAPTLMLVGPGGGGAGLNQKPYEPNYLDLTEPTIGTCDPCVPVNITCAEAAPGIDVSSSWLKTQYNLTFNPSNSFNFTRGCDGGYGGGGQGGALRDSTNATTSGGGGGGGGNPGGNVGKGGNAKSCTAGGPGKAFCIMTYCNVTRLNEAITGYFLIKFHETYKELPNRDRTNYERPGQIPGTGSNGNKLVFSLTSLFIAFSIREIFAKERISE